MEDRQKHPLFELFIMLLIMGGMYVVSILFGILIVVVLVVSGVDIDSSDILENRGALMLTQTVTQLMVMVVPVVALMMIYRRHEWRDCIKADFTGKSWLLALAGTVMMMLIVPMNEYLTVWNDGWQLGELGEKLRAQQEITEGVMEKLLGGGSIGDLLCNLLVVALVPAISEELFFRVGLQGQLGRWLKNRHVAVIITAAIFSLSHGEVFSFMPRFVMGILLGYMFEYGGSIVVNVSAHFMNNAIVVLLYWVVQRYGLDMDLENPLDFGWLLTACCTMAAVFLFWCCFLRDGRKGSLPTLE